MSVFTLISIYNILFDFDEDKYYTHKNLLMRFGDH